MESCGRTSFFVKAKGPRRCAGSPFKVTGCPQTRLSLQNSKRVILLRRSLLRGLCKGARLRRHMLETRLHPHRENTTESRRTATAVLVSCPHRAISRVKAMGEVIKTALEIIDSRRSWLRRVKNERMNMTRERFWMKIHPKRPLSNHYQVNAGNPVCSGFQSRDDDVIQLYGPLKRHFSKSCGNTQALIQFSSEEIHKAIDVQPNFIHKLDLLRKRGQITVRFQQDVWIQCPGFSTPCILFANSRVDPKQTLWFPSPAQA